ncbi:MAG: peptide deformylase [Acidobacteria bacterium]|nr:peptide deformylase [Acidobacteriota bacterium]
MAQEGLEETDEAEEAPELDEERLARRAAALRHVRQFGDPVLKSKATPVTEFDDGLRESLERMAHLMGEAIGVGLAANQVGELRRMLVYRLGEDEPWEALVNPQIEWFSDEKEPGFEGCLSLPEVSLEIERPLRIRVRAQDRFGEERQFEAEGLEARVIQHEVDHLDGVLILDRASRSDRREAMKILREATRGS